MRQGRGGTWPPAFRNVALVVLAATPFSGCDVPRPPAEVVEPSIIGVVEAIDHSARGRIAIVDGTEITWDHVVFEVTSRPGAAGDLLIYGTEPIEGGDAPWLMMVPPSVATVRDGPGERTEARPACYLLSANGEVRGDRMALSTGFSLPLADPEDAEWREGELIDNLGHHFCLDEAGQIVGRQ